MRPQRSVIWVAVAAHCNYILGKYAGGAHLQVQMI